MNNVRLPFPCNCPRCFQEKIARFKSSDVTAGRILGVPAELVSTIRMYLEDCYRLQIEEPKYE